MEREIAYYDALTNWPDVQQLVQDGQRFVIMDQNGPVAFLLPIDSEVDIRKKRSMHAAEQLLQMMLDQKPSDVDIRAMINEGRD